MFLLVFVIAAQRENALFDYVTSIQSARTSTSSLWPQSPPPPPPQASDIASHTRTARTWISANDDFMLGVYAVRHSGIARAGLKLDWPLCAGATQRYLMNVPCKSYVIRGFVFREMPRPVDGHYAVQCTIFCMYSL